MHLDEDLGENDGIYFPRKTSNTQVPLKNSGWKTNIFFLKWHLSSGDVLVFEGLYFCSSGECVFCCKLKEDEKHT